MTQVKAIICLDDEYIDKKNGFAVTKLRAKGKLGSDVVVLLEDWRPGTLINSHREVIQTRLAAQREELV